MRRPPVPSSPIEHARALFRNRFGGEPALGFQAPGRVNLIGEHTDYNAGLVLPIAIERRCVALGAPGATPGALRVAVASDSSSVEIDLRKPLDAVAIRRSLPKWAWYVAGVAEMIRRRIGPVPGLDIAVASSVPLGAGLSSSASLEVAIAGLLLSAAGASWNDLDLARLCQRAEHEFAGVPCGLMDQLASVSGRAGHALLIDCRDDSMDAAPVPAGLVVVVINTLVPHNLGQGEYAKRRSACESAAMALGVRTLRDADLARLESTVPRLNDEQRRCATHVITEIVRTAAAAEALRLGTPDDLANLGLLMTASHDSLRRDYRVSCPELDLVVDTASRVPGVIGARMTGGGFGGCAIALAHAHAAPQVQTTVSQAFRHAFGRDCDVFVTHAAAGAGPVDPARPHAETPLP